MKKFKYLGFAAAIALAATGCDDVFVDNVNPDAAHTNTLELGLPVVVFYSSQVNYDHAEYNVYLSQCLTTMSKSTTGSYPYKNGWEFLTVNRHPQWRRHFYDIGVNANEIIEHAREKNSPNYELIARAIKLMSTQLTTDAWGDMPRSEAYKSNSPKYDTQASIYKWMLEEADELIPLFDDPEWGANPNNLTITEKQDRIYAGNMQGWKGLVQAIKARILLRNIPNIDCSAATCQKIYNAAQAAIDTWTSGDLKYGEMFGNEPRYYYNEGAVGESANPWSAANPKINSWESRENLLSSAVPSKFFIQDCMGVIEPGVEGKQGFWDRENGYGSDLRLFFLLVPQSGPKTPSSTTNAVMIRYLENNIGAGSTYKQTHFPDLYCSAYTGSISTYNPLFIMEELYFIQAEAQYWMGNKATACQIAKQATKMNVERQLQFYLAKSNGLYPASGNTPGTASQVDMWKRMYDSFFDNVATKKCKPASEIGNKHWFFDESNYTLSDLMIQKYIALYLIPEQWTDLRRYHYSNNRNGYGIGDAQEIIYPTLRRPYNLYAAYWIDGLTVAEQERTWIQRYNYDPETEEKYNLPELERLGASKNPMWLRKPMIWAEEAGARKSLTEE